MLKWKITTAVLLGHRTPPTPEDVTGGGGCAVGDQDHASLSVSFGFLADGCHSLFQIDMFSNDGQLPYLFPPPPTKSIYIMSYSKVSQQCYPRLEPLTFSFQVSDLNCHASGSLAGILGKDRPDKSRSGLRPQWLLLIRLVQCSLNPHPMCGRHSQRQCVIVVGFRRPPSFISRPLSLIGETRPLSAGGISDCLKYTPWTEAVSHSIVVSYLRLGRQFALRPGSDFGVFFPFSLPSVALKSG